MKMLLGAIASAVLLLIVFFAGMASQQAWMILPAFCAWSPCMIWIGFTAARAGAHLRSPVAVAPKPRTTSKSAPEYN